MARTTDTSNDTTPDASASAPGGHRVDPGVPAGEAADISKVVGAGEGGPVIEHPAPMYWMRSLETGNVYPAFNLSQREELANNGCEELPLDEHPDGMPKATGMAGTGLLA